MPELPEVETVCRGLQPHIVGRMVKQVLLHRADLRIAFPPLFAERLTGRKVVAVSRRAKYILITMDDGLIWLIHLGMSGSIRLLHTPEHAEGNAGQPPLKKHDHVVVRLDEGWQMMYHDPRRFGLMTLVEQGQEHTHPLLQHLGVEPLSDDFTAEYLRAACAKKSVPIKQAIMQQEIVVGVGNIYASEALFRAGIVPTKPVNQCEHLSELVTTIRDVLRDAIASGGSTLRDYVNAEGDSGYFQHRFDVYGRENQPCTRCASYIRRITQQGRSTFFCDGCQN
jgi:formamidopyrimidine-DNA glycosylase